MIRGRLSLLFSRSKRRLAYRRFYELARDAFFAATRINPALSKTTSRMPN
ncbi:MAG: hypothetical protein ACLQME_18870 [Alphaproteobacteria bacterium]